MKSNQNSIQFSQELTDLLYVSDQDKDDRLVKKAIKFALDNRINKEKLPYSIEVAVILRSFDVDQTTLLAAILSDRDFLDSLADSTLTEEYGKTIMTLVTSVRWLNTFRNCENGESAKPTVPEQAERLRRMLLAMVDDVRAVLIKLAWRLYHLRILDKSSYFKRHCVAQETLDIFAPLANRLGISQMKWELEDLSFRYLDPLVYKQIAKSLNDKRVEREEYIDAFVTSVEVLVAELKMVAEVYGRPKHIYSIYKKMQRKNLDSIDQLYDLRAIRIIVEDKGACYKLLGEIHAKWPNIPDEYDDYIANKKPNGYQSLHTVVYGPQGNTIEIQIRTHDMHAAAELGVASHWRYKEGAAQSASMETAIASFRDLLSREENDRDLLEDFRSEVFVDRVFALTPKGDIMDLPLYSTPLDFAYAVHTSIGHRCHGAKVNGNMVPLTYQLKNGQQVEILTRKEENPKRRWLNNTLGYLQSSKARNAVRHWLRQQNHETNKKDGLAVLEREAHRLAIPRFDIKKLVDQFKLQSKDEFLIALGRGDISAQQISNALSPPAKKKKQILSEGKSASGVSKQAIDLQGVQVEGVGNILINIANCCKPVPGDGIVGYITLGRGVSIHRSNCPNINPENLSEEQQSRLVVVSWGEDTRNYSVDIQVAGLDRPGLLSDTASVLATERVNILDIGIQHEDNTLRAIINITVQVENTGQLKGVLAKLSQLPSVLDVTRAG
ncbi:MAG: bifunctional (p)ppGpp synthetase/guanosine-3',5'-bis(diphosphate) 3'-pyrophosphohydrolase [Thiotrichaceae bacterium]